MIAAAVAVALTLTGTPAPADQPYVLVAWEVANPDSIWETPQTLETWTGLTDPTLDALDASLPCGATFQVDLYWADNDSAALIAGGFLYGPQNPKEPHAYVVEGDPWKFVTTAPCVVKPEVRPFHDARQEVTCESVTTFTRDGFFDLDFDPIGNVWSERVEPTVTSEASSVAPNAAPDASCSPTGVQLPTLAETGVEPYDGWLFGALGAALLGLGVAVVGLARELRRRNRGA